MTVTVYWAKNTTQPNIFNDVLDISFGSSDYDLDFTILSLRTGGTVYVNNSEVLYIETKGEPSGE